MKNKIDREQVDCDLVDRERKSRLREKVKLTTLLFRTIPSPVVALFVISVVTMNLLANKTLVQTSWLAIDGGILVSWISFLCMDVVTKRFGPRAATKMSVFAIATNLLACLIFYVVSIIPTPGIDADYTAFNTIFGGTWFILLSSTVAFFLSSLINNFLNFAVGALFRRNPDGRAAFFMRSYVSTFAGQFADNLIFAVLTFTVFAPIFWDGFRWTFVQCVTCSLLGAMLELLMEVVFSPLGYMVCRRWERDNVGNEYIAAEAALYSGKAKAGSTGAEAEAGSSDTGTTDKGTDPAASPAALPSAPAANTGTDPAEGPRTDRANGSAGLKVLISGTSRGIGRAAALKYLKEGCEVVGVDRLGSTIDHPAYTHFVADVSDAATLPEIEPAPNIIFVNAGVQNSGDDISVNLRGAINVTEKYAFQPRIQAVLFNASASARSGFEFPEYVASKAGVVGYMKNAAVRLAKYGAVVNAISPGGVLTESNRPVTEDPELWARIMEATPLKKWLTEDELAEWVWFLTADNRSASGIDVLVDNGELALNSTFVWPD